MFGNGDEGDTTSRDWAAQSLASDGYDVTDQASLPADLSGYGAIFYIGTDPIDVASEPALESFVESGGGLYLTGERPCCESLNSADSEIVNTLVKSGGVTVGGLGDPFYATGAVPVNQDSAGRARDDSQPSQHVDGFSPWWYCWCHRSQRFCDSTGPFDNSGCSVGSCGHRWRGSARAIYGRQLA